MEINHSTSENYLNPREIIIQHKQIQQFPQKPESQKQTEQKLNNPEIFEGDQQKQKQKNINMFTVNEQKKVNNLQQLQQVNNMILPIQEEKKLQNIIKYPVQVIQIIEQNNRIQQQIECQFCAEILQKNNFQKVFLCKHMFCKNCLKIYFETQILNFQILRCPQENCRKQLDLNSNYYQTLQKKQKYQLILFRKQIQQTPNRVLCPGENCLRGYIEINEAQKNGTCKQCKTIYCLNCKMKDHSGECDNFSQNLLKNKFNYKKCFGCKRIVERTQGCPHMTCKCTAQFCYYCGKKWESTHRCLRIIAGAQQLITDKLNNNLLCIIPENYKYQQTAFSYLTRIPYYIALLLLVLLYVSWCIFVFALYVSVVAVASSFGFFFILLKACQSNNSPNKCIKIIIIFLVIFIPIGIIIGWFVMFGAIINETLPKFLSLSLAGRLFPCYIL